LTKFPLGPKAAKEEAQDVLSKDGAVVVMTYGWGQTRTELNQPKNPNKRKKRQSDGKGEGGDIGVRN